MILQFIRNFLRLLNFYDLSSCAHYIDYIRKDELMNHDVTNLVNNVILPQTEPDDIIGIEYIKYVSVWIYLPEIQVGELVSLYKAGAFHSLILIEGTVFAGTGSSKVEDIRYVERNIKRIKTHEIFT